MYTYIGSIGCIYIYSIDVNKTSCETNSYKACTKLLKGFVQTWGFARTRLQANLHKAHAQSTHKAHTRHAQSTHKARTKRTKHAQSTHKAARTKPAQSSQQICTKLCTKLWQKLCAALCRALCTEFLLA